jgi:sugar phosphate isomerase/epimerase
MLIGAMNHPRHDVIAEIQEIAALGLQFVDLSLEPPAAASWHADPRAIRDCLDRNNLKVVGHTAYYLPIASPFEEVRLGAVTELRRCLRMFAQIGANWMNIHPDRPAPMHDRQFCIDQNLRSLRELLPVALELGVGLMIENLPDGFNNVAQLSELLEPIPELGLHLDIGHCNLRVPQNSAEELIRRYADRLAHVHLHDNAGGYADLHLPLGAGTIDVPHHIRILKRHGYDGMITLEVFSEDTHYLTHSAQTLRRMWDQA